MQRRCLRFLEQTLAAVDNSAAMRALVVLSENLCIRITDRCSHEKDTLRQRLLRCIGSQCSPQAAGGMTAMLCRADQRQLALTAIAPLFNLADAPHQSQAHPSSRFGPVSEPQRNGRTESALR